MSVVGCNCTVVGEPGCCGCRDADPMKENEVTDKDRVVGNMGLSGYIKVLPPKDGPKDGSMITAANTLEASPKPSYGPHKANERYLDWEDKNAFAKVSELATDCVERDVTADELLQALETLRTHLRRKYYAG